MDELDKGVESKIIELYISGQSMAKIGNLFDINPSKVFKILKDNSIERRTKGGIYKLQDNIIIDRYKQGESCQSIADSYGVSFHTISTVLEKNGIPRNNIYYNLDLVEDYWENIDSSDKAYFLGMLITDGNVFGNSIRLELSSKDIDILKIFAEKTRNSNKISSDSRNLAHFSVKREKWVQDLVKYGVCPNKTSTTYFPNIPQQFNHDLIRGLIDGDGWISSKSHQLGFCGSERLVTEVRDFLVSTLDVYNVKVLHSGKNLWQITWSGRGDILKIGNYIYDNKEDCYLKRKFNNWIEIIKEIPR